MSYLKYIFNKNIFHTSSQIIYFFVFFLGRTKLEPVAIVVLSVIMSLASAEMIKESIEKIISYTSEACTAGSPGKNHTEVVLISHSKTECRPIVEWPTIVICSFTIGEHCIPCLREAQAEGPEKYE